MSEKLTIVDRPIDELIPAEYNPRELSVKAHEHLTASIQRFGLVDPLLINVHPDRKNIIIGGHMRWRIAKELGFTVVPCVELNLTPEKEKELNIRLNKNTGAFSDDLLSSHFDAEDLLAWGFEPSELGGFDGSSVGENDDEIPDTVKCKVISKPHDLYVMTANGVTLRILCGDTRNVDDVKKVMDGKQADLCITDPPFNVDNEGGDKVDPNRKGAKIENDKMPTEDFVQFMRDVFTSTRTAMKDGAAIYSFMSGQELGRMQITMEEVGFHWSSFIVWNKDRIVPGRRDYQSKHEQMYYGWHDCGPRVLPLEDRTEPDVWDCDRPSASPLHPTTKPVALYSRAVKNSAKPGWTLIDFFLGSGTAAVAAVKHGLNFCGIEVDPRYVDVALRRVADYCKSESIAITSLTRNGEAFPIEHVYEAADVAQTATTEAAKN